MSTYIINFEVDDPVRLQKMKDHLVTYGSYCPINNNCWAVIVNKNSTEIRDELMVLQQETDKIFVIRSGTEASWVNAYSQEHSDWLKKYL